MGAVPAPAQRLLEIAATNTDRLVRLINDILDIDRIESGNVTLRSIQCDAAGLARQAIDAIQPLADRENITITLDAVTASMIADPDRIIRRSPIF